MITAIFGKKGYGKDYYEKRKKLLKELDIKLEELNNLIEEIQINKITNHAQCYKQLEYVRFIKDIIVHKERWWFL